jgi:hypothetical protein
VLKDGRWINAKTTDLTRAQYNGAVEFNKQYTATYRELRATNRVATVKNFSSDGQGGFEQSSGEAANAAPDNGSSSKGAPGQGHNGGPPLDEDDASKGVLKWLGRLAGRLGGAAVSLFWSEPAGEGSDIVQHGQLPENPSQTGHIFRQADGHYSEATPSAIREINQAASSRGTFHGRDSYGNIWQSRINTDGSQTWVRIRNDVITNAGRNPTPIDIKARMP